MNAENEEEKGERDRERGEERERERERLCIFSNKYICVCMHISTCVQVCV